MAIDLITVFQEKIKQAIEELELAKQPCELYEPIHYTFGLGGKRIRPVLTLLGYSCTQKNWESILKPALSVELFHNFTLMHDDIMDNAPRRRGQLSVCKKWNNNIAILSGDALMILAYNLLAEAEYVNFKYLLKLFNTCALEVCKGQQLDMNFELQSSVSETEYLEMIRLKTAVLLGYSLELGTLLGGMSPNQAKYMRDFGVNIGIGFQLKDDLLDVYGDPNKFGKQIGGDIIANKKTLLWIKAIELSNSKQKQELHHLMTNRNIAPKVKVQKVTAIYKSLNIQVLIEHKMHEYFATGFEKLDYLKALNFDLKPLMDFTKLLIHRDY